MVVNVLKVNVPSLVNHKNIIKILDTIGPRLLHKNTETSEGLWVRVFLKPACFSEKRSNPIFLFHLRLRKNSLFSWPVEQNRKIGTTLFSYFPVWSQENGK